MKYVKLLGIALILVSPLFWVAAQNTPPADAGGSVASEKAGHGYKVVFVRAPSVGREGGTATVPIPIEKGWELVTVTAMESPDDSNHYSLAYTFKKASVF